MNGWIDASFRDSDLDEDGSNFAINHLNGLLDLRFEDRWQLFVEAELEYQPEVATFQREREVEVEQAYVKVDLSDTWELRSGVFSTPFGYWTPVHWTIATDTVLPPIFEERRLVPEQQLGARLTGTRFLRLSPDRDLRIEGSLYGGYASSAADIDDGSGPTAGADLRFGNEDHGFLGASLYTQQDQGASGGREREVAAMLYGELRLPWNLSLRGEYLSHRGARIEGADRRRELFYAKIRWSYRRWSLNYRFERAEDVELGPSALHRVHRFTVGYAPTPRLRLRAEFAGHRVDRGRVGDFRSMALWIGVFF